MKIVKANKNSEVNVTDVEAKADSIWKANVHKFIAYPIIFIVCYFVLNLCFFNLMPYVNMLGFMAFGNTVDNFIIYYPSFLVLDAAIALVGWHVCKIFAKTFTGFVKKLVDKSRAKKESKK